MITSHSFRRFSIKRLPHEVFIDNAKALDLDHCFKGHFHKLAAEHIKTRGTLSATELFLCMEQFSVKLSQEYLPH